MPNHIINTIRLTGDRQKISELLESVRGYERVLL